MHRWVSTEQWNGTRPRKSGVGLLVALLPAEVSKPSADLDAQSACMVNGSGRGTLDADSTNAFYRRVTDHYQLLLYRDAHSPRPALSHGDAVWSSVLSRRKPG